MAIRIYKIIRHEGTINAYENVIAKLFDNAEAKKIIDEMKKNDPYSPNFYTIECEIIYEKNEFDWLKHLQGKSQENIVIRDLNRSD